MWVACRVWSLGTLFPRETFSLAMYTEKIQCFDSALLSFWVTLYLSSLVKPCQDLSSVKPCQALYSEGVCKPGALQLQARLPTWSMEPLVRHIACPRRNIALYNAYTVYTNLFYKYIFKYYIYIYIYIYIYPDVYKYIQNTHTYHIYIHNICITLYTYTGRIKVALVELPAVNMFGFFCTPFPFTFPPSKSFKIL